MVRWASFLAVQAMHVFFIAWIAAFFALGPGFVRAPSAAQIKDLVSHGQVRAFPLQEGGGQGGKCHLPYFVTLDEVSPHVMNALLAVEDRRFYEHFGIDLKGIGRALAANMLGRSRQGGSTLTQQLVKNVLFESSDDGLRRKLLEIPIAITFELALSKREILTGYLNQVYFAGDVIGIEAAARRFYGKTAKDLNALEAAVLVGMLKSPRDYSPATNHEAALSRARLVLDKELAAGLLTQKQLDKVLRTGEKPGSESLYEISCEHFRDWVLRSVQAPASDQKRFRVVVTLDAWKQAELVYAADRVLRSASARNASQVAAVHLGEDGAVRAMLGGTDYAASQFNRATTARRSPGSTAKLFLYAEACRQGWGPQDELVDRPLTPDGWPANFDGENWGPLTLYRSFVWSRNGSAAQLEREVGVARVVALARRFGIGGDLPTGRGFSLGSFGATPLDMTAAYAAIANGGLRAPPFGVIGVIGPLGSITSWRSPPRPERVLSAACTAQMQRLLRGVVKEGTGREANFSPRVRGKTGTSDGNRDAWFIGDVGGAVIGVWIGNDDNSPMLRVSGGNLPAALFRSYASSLAPAEGPQRVARGPTH